MLEAGKNVEILLWQASFIPQANVEPEGCGRAAGVEPTDHPLSLLAPYSLLDDEVGTWAKPGSMGEDTTNNRPGYAHYDRQFSTGGFGSPSVSFSASRNMGRTELLCFRSYKLLPLVIQARDS
ncbi:hypothetical protein PABG_11042 [Paracoccidioides brasiliensis Pb03]|nr:hypothetical protein PABG_11042 [Paracoccidioides brasiliensis Pb03]